MKKIFLLILMLPFIFSCSNDDENIEEDDEIVMLLKNEMDKIDELRDRSYIYISHIEYTNNAESTEFYTTEKSYLKLLKVGFQNLLDGHYGWITGDELAKRIKEDKERIDKVESGLHFFTSNFINPTYRVLVDLEILGNVYVYINADFKYLGWSSPR